MIIVEPSFEIMDMKDGPDILKKIELAGRVCYKSEDRITEESAIDFVGMIEKRGHHTVLEHEYATVRVVCDRGVSHEIVRHRIASYSQESTRYCNYSKDKFGEAITVIKPVFWNEGDENYETWKKSMEEAEKRYFELIKGGANAQQARSVLPNSLKTEIVMTLNLRAWKHFFDLRAASAAHPQMREIAVPLKAEFMKRLPAVFGE